ncbi:MAG: 4-hydroxythreonine-4-phosphate dehydrogenase PdxA [Bacteroidetes bacterium]|nr:MAG: 4-hydroxythreonine-4-phosphate dehydrogenase PdxA [Bacteroidota bacterium]
MNGQSNRKLRIGITMGDVNGIGPELIIKAFMDSRLRDICIPIVYGSARVINIYRKVLRINKFNYQTVQTPSQAHPGKLNIIECLPGLERIEIGKHSELGGKAAIQALQRAIADAQHTELDALVTMPVDKAALQMHEPSFMGHTELLAKAFNVKESLMLMVSDRLRVGLVTNHLPLAEVARNLSVDRIVRKAKLLTSSLENDFSLQQPMIALLGLNPHAGDRGLIGTEDSELIGKAVELLKAEGIHAFGPYPSDGFFGSMTYQRFDGVLAMYHDQGLIPFKLLAGYEGTNFTAGIPFIRTSPDHGVAYDIAGKGTADPGSLRQALYLAIDVHEQRALNAELKANPLPMTDTGPERSRGRRKS